MNRTIPTSQPLIPTMAIGAEELFSIPELNVPKKLSVVSFSVTTYCNLSCKGCGRSIDISNGVHHDEHMSAANFEKILDHLPPMGLAVLQGLGEPTLNPEFIEICKIAKESGKIDKIMFHTNAVTRGVKFLAKITDFVNWFAVSVDTLNDDFVDQTRTGTSVSKLKRRLHEMKDAGLNFVINMVASRYNYHDIPSTLKILNDIGCFNVNIQLLESNDLNDPGVLSNSEVNALRIILQIYQSSLPRLTVSLPQRGREVRNDHHFCNVGAPIFAPNVLASGFLTLCCRSTDSAKFGKMNLIDQSFEEIWNSTAIRRYLRDFIVKGDKMCDGCQHYNRSVISTDLMKSDPDERAKNTLLPAINMADSIGDTPAALKFVNEFLQTYPNHKIGLELLRLVEVRMSQFS